MDRENQDLLIGDRNWIYHVIPYRDGVTEAMRKYGEPNGELTYFFNYVFPSAYV